MRLKSLTLARYGNFDAECIHFDPRPGVLNVLLAPNGGGKSVLRSAFCDLLFGIGGQSPMGFRYGYPRMRITADALGPNGEAFTLGRRKGQGNTLIDADGGTLDPALLTRLLGPVDRNKLERLFALDTDRLRKGEADLLASNGELGPALVSGAGGTRDLRAIRKSLEEARDSLAPTRRSAQRPFYLALDKFVDARKRENATLLSPDQWQKLQQELDAAIRRRIDQNHIVEAESAEIARLERVRRVIPWLAAHDVAAAWLTDHPDAPVLDLGLTKRLADARSEIVIVEQRSRREHQRATELADRLGQVAVDDRLLLDAAEIERLVVASGAARKAAADLPGVEADVKARNAEVTACLRQLGSDLPTERAGEAIPSRTSITRTRRLVQAFTPLRQTAQEAPELVNRRRQECDSITQELAVLTTPNDVSDLDALVKDIRADGDPARRKRDAAQLRNDALENLAASLARVPGWTTGAEALITLAPLSQDAYDRYYSDVTAQRAEAVACSEKLQSAKESRDEARENIKYVTKSVSLPDGDALDRARTRRDRGWQIIYRRAFTAEPAAPHEEAAFAESLPLPLAYERAVTTADTIADRRVQDAEIIASLQAAQIKLAHADTEFQEAEARHRLAAEAQAAVERTWEQLCEGLNLGAMPTFREVQAFLAAREKVIDAQRIMKAAAAAETAIDATHAGWADRLAAKLMVPPDSSLSSLLTAADKRLAAAQQAEKVRVGLDARRTAMTTALTEAQTAQGKAEAALAEWRSDWAHAMKELGRTQDEDPHVMDDVLQVFADLEKAQKERPAQVERVAGMQRDNARFAEDTAALARRVASDLTATDPFVLVAELRHRSQQAGERARQRDLLQEQLLDATKSAELAERQLADRQAVLDSILLLIGAETIELAEQRLVLATERARHAASLAEAEAKLREAGDLRPLAQLREEAAAVPSEEVPGRIGRAEQRRKEAQQDAQGAAVAASELEQQMRLKAAETGARDAAADQQAAVATIGRVLEEALVNHVAAEMLDRALAAMEQDGESELLRRISTLFKMLTDGAYSRVLTEIGDDNLTCLTLMQRDFPDERQSVQELSEGTRDQLYLALRLAAVEAHAAVAPSLPFIGDDILQTFDDDRALAAMRVLGEISQRVQVILLTHHRHVLDLAARLPADTVHICRLGATAPQAA